MAETTGTHSKARKQTRPREARSTVRQHAERAVLEEAPAILAAGSVAHVAFADGDQPFVIPFSYSYDPESPRKLYLHGSPSSRALHHLAKGKPVCIAVTLLDGLVYSRSAKYHSMNYRSVVCFGRARAVSDLAEKDAVLERMIARYFPGRTPGRDYAAPEELHLRQTLLIEVTINEWSAKARRGGPKGPRDAELEAPGTCGVIGIEPWNH